MLGLVIFPMLFFMIGFLFKVFRPYYKPAEFVFFNMMAAMIALVVANGSTLFITIPFFIQMALLHVGIYLVFAFVGLLTQNIYGWFNNRFPIVGEIGRGITMVALICVMMTACFSIQYILTLVY